jgi:hypothetical protein
MNPRLSLLTPGVDDLQRSLTFSRDGLGLVTQGIVGTEIEHGSVDRRFVMWVPACLGSGAIPSRQRPA